MKYVPAAVTRTIARQTLRVKKNSPAILFVGGVAGMVGTVILSSRATLKLEGVLESLEKDKADAGRLLDLNRSDYTQDDYDGDIRHLYVRATVDIVKLYGPSFVLGVTSIACLTGAHNIQTKRYAGLTAAYATLDRAFSEYRQRVVDEVGAEKEEEIRYGIEKCDYVDELTGKSVTGKHVTPKGRSPYSRVFDEVNSRRWSRTPENNQFFLASQQQYLNDMLKSKGHVFLNDVYDALGFERVPEGQIVGWLYEDRGNGDGYIDFGIFDADLWQAKRFINGDERSIFLDFNVDGNIWDKI